MVLRTLFVVVAIVTSLVGATIAHADATPIQIILMYTPNVSNTNTPAATGIAELVMAEGEFRLESANLPRLGDDQQYAAWALNTSTNDFQLLGVFNTAESTGAIHYENVLPDAIPDKRWNLLLVTVETDPTPARPSGKHSIAGTFPSGDAQSLPEILPNTGGDPDAIIVPPSKRAEWLPTAGLAALTLTLGAGAGYAFGRRTAR